MEQDTESLYLVTTDARCIDESMGQYLDDYLDGTLSRDDAEKFEAHLCRCLACQADLSNTINLFAALEASRDSIAADETRKARSVSHGK
jgi:anti-sigma factor RsiW